MNYENIILSVIAFIGGGGLLRLWQMRNTTDTNLARGWKDISKDLRTQMERMEARFIEREAAQAHRIDELELLIEQREQLYQKKILEKDEEISNLKEEVRELRHDLRNFQQETVSNAEEKSLAVETVKQELHHEVEAKVDKLKP